MEKQTITARQKSQFNQMRATLIKISKYYQTSSQLRRNSEKKFGLEYEECLEMTYDNIQVDAARSVKGVAEL